MKFGKMKTHRRNRLLLVLFLVAGVGGATTFALLALNENINLFYSPEQIVAGEAPVDRMIRAGGMVVEGSVHRSAEDLSVSFSISDLRDSEVVVQYIGILPDLFREGQGAVIEGYLENKKIVKATNIFAKHDENYMPASIKDNIKNKGYWKKNY